MGEEISYQALECDASQYARRIDDDVFDGGDYPRLRAWDKEILFRCRGSRAEQAASQHRLHITTNVDRHGLRPRDH